MKPPAALLAPCPSTAFTGTTNGELARWALRLDSSLARCNEDKRLLRDWAAD